MKLYFVGITISNPIDNQHPTIQCPSLTSKNAFVQSVNIEERTNATN